MYQGDDAMPYKTGKINVIIHAPTDKESLDALQSAVDELYVRMIYRELSSTDLTYEEKEQVIRRIAESLDRGI